MRYEIDGTEHNLDRGEEIVLRSWGVTHHLGSLRGEGGRQAAALIESLLTFWLKAGGSMPVTWEEARELSPDGKRTPQPSRDPVDQLPAVPGPLQSPL